MNERAFLTLRRNKELHRFIEEEAHRHFGRSEDDREDATAEAWERIWAQPAGLGLEEYKRNAGNAIAAYYNRVRRRQKRQTQLDAEPEGNPPPAMQELTRPAVEGDW